MASITLHHNIRTEYATNRKLIIKFLFIANIMIVAMDVNSLPYNDTSNPDLFIQNNLPKNPVKYKFNPLSLSMLWVELYTVTAASCVNDIREAGIDFAFKNSKWCMNFMGPSKFTVLNKRAFDYYENNKYKMLSEFTMFGIYDDMTAAKMYKSTLDDAIQQLCTRPGYQYAEFCGDGD